MYIIEDGKAYQVKDDVAYRIKFDGDGKMIVDKEEKISTKGKRICSYVEVYKRLNVAYAIKMSKLKKENSEEIQTLEEKIKVLEEENESLKKKLQETKEKTNKSKGK